MCRHTQFYTILKIECRSLCMLGRHSTVSYSSSPQGTFIFTSVTFPRHLSYFIIRVKLLKINSITNLTQPCCPPPLFSLCSTLCCGLPQVPVGFLWLPENQAFKRKKSSIKADTSTPKFIKGAGDWRCRTTYQTGLIKTTKTRFIHSY